MYLHHHSAQRPCNRQPIELTASDCWSIMYAGPDKQPARGTQRTSKHNLRQSITSAYKCSAACAQAEHFFTERSESWQACTPRSPLFKAVFHLWSYEMSDWSIASDSDAFTQDAQFYTPGVAFCKNLPFSLPAITGYFFSIWFFVEAMDTSGIPQRLQYY